MLKPQLKIGGIAKIRSINLMAHKLVLYGHMDIMGIIYEIISRPLNGFLSDFWLATIILDAEHNNNKRKAVFSTVFAL